MEGFLLLNCLCLFVCVRQTGRQLKALVVVVDRALGRGLGEGTVHVCV